MKNRNLETLLTAAAHAGVIITVELLRAHRSSLWAPLSTVEWMAVATAWLSYALIIAMPSFLVAYIYHRAMGEEGYSRPSFLAPLVCSTLLIVLLAQPASLVSPIALAVALLAMALLTIAQFVHFRTYLASTIPPTIVALATIAGAILSMTVHSNFRLAREGASNSVVVNAIGTAFFIGALAYLAIAAFRALTQRIAIPHILLPILILVVGVVTLFVGHYEPARDFPPDSPSIVLVTVDTLRADVTSLHGGDVPTPNLERIAESSVVFDQAYTLAPWTLPSVFGMMASQYPPTLAADGDLRSWQREISRYRMPASPKTLAERLSEKGYTTAACISNSLLSDREGVLRGFEAVRVIGHRTHTLDGPLRGMPWLQSALHRAGFPWVYEKPADTTRVCTAFAESFLRSNRGEPFFLWIHCMDPHAAYAPPPKYAPKNSEWPVFCNADPYWGTPQSDEFGKLDLTDTQQADVRALYDAEVRYVDDAVGRVWDAARKLTNPSYFVLTADHGEAFWDHGEYGHGQSLFDHQIHVPLMLAGPALESRRVPDPVSQIDVVPTLAALTHMPHDEKWIGQSWVPWLIDAAASPATSPVFAQSTNVFSAEGPLVMTVEGQTKAIYNMTTGEVSVYNLDTDPLEQSPTQDEGRFKQQIENHLESHGENVSEVFERDHGDEASEQEMVEQLRSLGYLK